MSVKKRLIATLLVDRGQIVQTRQFKRTNPVGSAFTAVDFFNAWTVDEIMVLEISATRDHVDHFAALIEELSRRCFVPLSVGGKIRELQHVRDYTRAGADKVVINTAAVERPGLVEEIANVFGSQCLIVSIDAARDAAMPSGYCVAVDNAQRVTGLDAVDWAREVAARGAGEIMVNAVEHDGNKGGYDLDLVRRTTKAVTVPVIAMGGVGRWEHLAEGITQGGADAVAAGNIFHYTEHSTKKAKEYLSDAGLPMRASAFYKVNMPRRPKYRPF